MNEASSGRGERAACGGQAASYVRVSRSRRRRRCRACCPARDRCARSIRMGRGAAACSYSPTSNGSASHSTRRARAPEQGAVRQTLARRSATGPKTSQNSKLTAPITSTGTPPLRWIAVRHDPMRSSSTVPLEPRAANASILPGAPKGAVEVCGPVNAFIESDCPCAPALFSAKRIGPPRPRPCLCRARRGHDEHGLPAHFVGRCRYATLMLSSTSHLVLRGSVLGSVT